MFSRTAVSLFVLVLAELFVMIQLAAVIGSFTTALLLVFLSACGVFVLRSVGAGLGRAAVDRVSDPRGAVADDFSDRALVLLAGALLVVPGFVSAAAGALLLLPPTRALVRPHLRSRIQSWILPYQRFGRSGPVVDVDLVDDGSDVDVDPDVSDSHRPELR